MSNFLGYRIADCSILYGFSLHYNVIMTGRSWIVYRLIYDTVAVDFLNEHSKSLSISYRGCVDSPAALDLGHAHASLARAGAIARSTNLQPSQPLLWPLLRLVRGLGLIVSSPSKGLGDEPEHQCPQGGVTPIGAVYRAATAVKIFDRPKMALTTANFCP